MGVALHAAIHVAVTALLLREAANAWPLLLVLGGLHFLCDWTKLRCSGNSQASLFLIDQAVHVLILAALAWWFMGTPTVLPTWLLYIAAGWALIPALATFQWVVEMEMRERHMKRSAYARWIRCEGEWGIRWIGAASAVCVNLVFSFSSWTWEPRRLLRPTDGNQNLIARSSFG